MRSFLFTAVALFALVVVPLAFAQEAIAVLYGTDRDANVWGTVKFTKLNTTITRVEVSLTGITVNTNAQHGMHIHQYGDVMTDRGNGSSVGGHWVGVGSSSHGCPPFATRHEGDLGSWTVTAGGAITETKEVDLLTWEGDSLIGHAVVLHELADDCAQVNSSGNRLALGVIGYNAVAGITTNYNGTNYATCYLRPTQAVASNQVYGSFWFEQTVEGVKIYGEITGMTQNSVHGIHIHQWGDISNVNASAVGGHWNPTNAIHALPPTTPRHAGDLGNIRTYQGAVAYYYYVVPNSIFTLSQILGRGLTLHSDEDDGCGQPAGNSGVRIGQCTIGIATVTPPTPTIAIPTQSGSNCPGAPTPTATPTGNSATALFGSLALLLAALCAALLF